MTFVPRLTINSNIIHINYSIYLLIMNMGDKIHIFFRIIKLMNKKIGSIFYLLISHSFRKSAYENKHPEEDRYLFPTKKFFPPPLLKSSAKKENYSRCL